MIIIIPHSIWGSDPPERVAEMLRWLATLSYHNIAEFASEYVNDPHLMGPLNDEVPPPLTNPKEAVFSVSLIMFIP